MFAPLGDVCAAAHRGCLLCISLQAQLKEEEESKAASGTSKGSQPIGFDDVIKRAGRMKIDLSSQASMRRVGDSPLAYNIFGAACSVVEVDVLTGETSIIRTDIVYDCGKSLNPAIDIGQCEGAFVMGIGFFLREDELLHKDGTLESDGTWEYKPPCTSHRNVASGACRGGHFRCTHLTMTVWRTCVPRLPRYPAGFQRRVHRERGQPRWHSVQQGQR